MRCIFASDILDLSQNCSTQTGVSELDASHASYPGIGTEDSPNYYRFIRNLAKSMPSEQSLFLEIGCRFAAASMHWISGGKHKFACGIDINPLVRMNKIEERFRFILGSSSDPRISDEIRDECADAALIDADHTYESVRLDYEIWRHKVKSGGVIMFDDVDFAGYGVGSVFSSIPDSHGEKIRLPNLHPGGYGFGVLIKS